MVNYVTVARVQLSGFRCERCEHEWIPRQKGEEPTVCPRCKSPYWNRPRRAKRRGSPKKP
jgi:predicted Zn-ribbon and HTH transcriptional regulator